MILRCFCALTGVATALQALPPVLYPSNNGTTVGFSLATAPKAIYINSSFANHTDTEGLTLIPPTAYQFAEIFRQDISQLLNTNYSLLQVDTFPPTGIFLGQYKGNASDLTYEDGSATEEGYELQVGNGFVYVGGAGARGMFWGTRTLLQELLIANGTGLQAGRVADAPAYATRGYMLDAGRKWYAPDFLKDLCTYASFFKMSEFHYHSSDNYPLNRGHNETWQDVFSHFSLYPENKDLQGIVQRQNETLSRQQFEDLQTHCAQRGVTVVPEIEAPGHCLSITKWKPELALDKKDLLNLSHPDAIPTVKAIWSEFLPWFQTKEVHIGADEYDATLADDYINFVNGMADFVNSTSGKQIRIWGTNEPSKKSTISKDIVIQHWQYGESDPVQVQKDNYSLINSEDWWAYMSLKNDHTPIVPAPYPQFFNNTRTLNFANVPDWQWEPSLFNNVNTTEQLEPGARGNKGAILAAWNDNGPDATTQLEAYYAMREGIPVVAARAWAGHRGINVSTDGLQPTLDFLTTKAPGQNLDRDFPGSQNTLKATSGTLYGWNRTGPGVPNVTIGKGSYGPPYTLIINATAEFTLTGPDTFLSIETVPSNISSNGTTTLVFSTTDGFPYPLRSTAESDGQDSGAPGRIWTNVTTSTHHPVPINFPASIRIETDVVNGSRVWIDNNFKGRFEVFVFGGKNALFSWSQMALVAPLDTVGGGVTNLTLNAGIAGNYSAGNGPDGKPTSPPEHKPNAAGSITYSMPAVICGLAVAVLLTII